jgi:hypothetical protein
MDKKYFKCVLFCSILITGCNNAVYNTKNFSDSGSRSYYLPKGTLSIKIEREKAKDPVTISVVPKIISDINIPLYLHRSHSVWYDDKYTVQTDDNGLLQSINTTNTFKGVEFAKKVGELAESAVQIAAKAAAAASCAGDPNEDSFKMETDIDPYVDNLANLNQRLSVKCIQVHYVKPTMKAPSILNDGIDGILYRKITNFTIKVYSTINPANLKTITVPFPDTSSIETINVDRGYFVDRDVKLSFASGILKQDDTTYPSELIGFISLPIGIVKGISDATIGRFGSATTGLQNEKAYYEAIKARDDAVKALDTPSE